MPSDHCTGEHSGIEVETQLPTCPLQALALPAQLLVLHARKPDSQAEHRRRGCNDAFCAPLSQTAPRPPPTHTHTHTHLVQLLLQHQLMQAAVVVHLATHLAQVREVWAGDGWGEGGALEWR